MPVQLRLPAHLAPDTAIGTGLIDVGLAVRDEPCRYGLGGRLVASRGALTAEVRRKCRAHGVAKHEW